MAGIVRPKWSAGRAAVVGAGFVAAAAALIAPAGGMAAGAAPGSPAAAGTTVVWHGGGRDGGGGGGGGRDGGGGGRDGGGDSRDGGGDSRNGGGDSRNNTNDRSTTQQWRYETDGTAPSTLADIAKTTGVDRMWAAGYTGKGVGIALIDTGVTRIAGLNSGNVVYGPDLSFESQDAATRNRDNFGHGTHLAGIMVGNDATTGFKGLAPSAKLTSVKVGVRDGSVDVVQVLAAIDWVVAHRMDDPKNPIKVLALAYGTDSTQDYKSGPLAFAVEQAWKAGITVVVSGGNDGTGAPKLVNPAYDPFAIAVGATDDRATPAITDDVVADFSSRGDGNRRVDLVAPGRSVASLRDPGSYVDTTYPDAREGTKLFRGSGTSQSAAVVAGAVADLLQARPALTPDQVKAVLRASAYRLAKTDVGAGSGALLIPGAVSAAAPATKQSFTPSSGGGSLEAARGSAHVMLDDVTLTGEKDIFGNPFNTAAWAAASAARTSWKGGKWMGIEWTGDGWTAGPDGKSWNGRAWSGRAWSGRAWSGRAWSGEDWNSKMWGS